MLVSARISFLTMNYLEVFFYLRIPRGFCYLVVAVYFSCTMVREHGWHNIRSLLFVKSSLLYKVDFFFFLCLKGMCILLIVESSVPFTSRRSNVLTVLVTYFVAFLFSACFIYQLLRELCWKNSPCSSISVSFKAVILGSCVEIAYLYFRAFLCIFTWWLSLSPTYFILIFIFLWY